MAFWGYRPVLPEFAGVIPGRESKDESSAMGGYHIEHPTIRVIYQGGAEVLTLESRSQAENLFSLLKRSYQ